MNNFNKKKTLITGASGYIGSFLTKDLVDSGWDVHILVRPSSNLNLLNSVTGKITLHYFTGKQSDITEIFCKHIFDIVFHLASSISAKHSSSQLNELINCNIQLPIYIAEAMAGNGSYNFINTSTHWQHFARAEYRPLSLYAATKKSIEDLLYFYADDKGINIINLTLYDTYGPGDIRGKLISHLHKSYINKTKLLMSEGYQKVNLVHVLDVVRGYIIACKRLIGHSRKFPDNFEIFHLRSRNNYTIRDIVALFEEISGTRLNVVFGERALRKREILNPYSEGKILPDWSPKITLREGIKMLLK